MKKKGSQTISYANPPMIVSGASVVGPREGKGPLGSRFDEVKKDTLFGEKSWERAESSMLQDACELALDKAGKKHNDVDLFLAGDLLNQLISANFCARHLSIPFIGLFGACSTMVEACLLGSMVIDGGFGSVTLCGASSHHDTAERQFRYPTEFANQRPPTAQWTVTGAGAAVLGTDGGKVRISHATIGRVVDMGMSDPNDMGSAMAAAAADTIWHHFSDTNQKPGDYDVVMTGDLGSVGLAVTSDLLYRSGLDMKGTLQDCGLLIFGDDQDAHAGASGGACCAVVLCSHLLPELAAGKLKRVLLVGTGALFSTTSAQQGESIPCIAHAIALEGMG